MLRQRIADGIKEAMKAGDKPRLAAVRLIQSELKNKDVEVRGAGKTEASEEDILGVLQKMTKQRQESLAIYEKAGREDLAAVERSEIETIASFLPRQMSDDEVAAAIKAAIAETGAASMKDMGKVIGALRGQYAGRMDFGRASGLVKAALSG
ncbi:MAG: glutamyl-tRNA amidotransferase [Rhizobiales bacterium 65-9]|nr:GatB/YqeY domain-containing protein [Hyphomicrobiales bacterium]OJY33277.1 MAG: glutamyl-tRNA amidotransferase [Rhizobiales bacterium 65-9]